MKKYLALIIPAVIIGPFILVWAIGALFDMFSPKYRATGYERRVEEGRRSEAHKQQTLDRCTDEARRTKLGASAQIAAGAECMKAQGY